MYEWTMVLFMLLLVGVGYWFIILMGKKRELELIRLSDDIGKRINELQKLKKMTATVHHLIWVKTNLDYIITGVKPCEKQ